MPRCYASVTFAVLVLLGCSEQSNAVKEDGHPKPGEEPGQATAESAPAAPKTPAVPEGLVVVAEPDAAGALHLRIQNRGRELLSLRPQLGIAKQGENEDLTGQKLSVRSACEEHPTGCIALAPGAELLPSPVHLRQGDMQCGAGGPSLANASYEVVVHGCQEQPYRVVTATLSEAR